MPEQSQTRSPTAPAGAERLTVPVGQDDHVIGPENAAVTLVEYGDFQCPYCAQAHRGLLTIRQSASVRVVWRHYPIAEIHPRAEAAAVAAEAAGRQARFWEMHDLLLANQRRLADADLIDHAKALGLDLDRFRDDLVDDSTLARVHADARGGLESGIRGTPSFFVDGKHDVRPWPVILASLRS
jgi:protein-disulfide isomerase